MHSMCAAEPASHARLRSLQIFSLLVLVAQNAALVLIMRYARTRAGDMFMSTSAVVSAEVMKLVFCLIVIFYEHRGDVVAFGSYICDVSGSLLSFRRFSLELMFVIEVMVVFFSCSALSENRNRLPVVGRYLTVDCNVSDR